jgi:hypothetical protein
LLSSAGSEDGTSASGPLDGMSFGGGGGIGLTAGMSGLYPVATYLIIVAIAVAPVPLIILLSGKLWLILSA